MGQTIAITGINSYFAATLLPRLESDPAVDTIIGIDNAPWKGGYTKVRFFREDIRSPKLADILRGADTVFHMAFIVGEIRDKKATSGININGTKNVFDACVSAGVRKIVYTSSATVYGADIHNPLGITEDRPPLKHKDSYYNASKVDVEKLVADYTGKYPDMIFTTLRAALLFGPRINNMFSKLFSMKLSALPPGVSYTQYVHEEDLGKALHLAFSKDLPGIYNVGADDAIATISAFKQAGVMIVPIPAFLLKWLATIGFFLRIFPAGGGWVTLGRYTIFMNCEKFKAATGWRPEWTSEATFSDFLKSREPAAPDNITQSILSWIFSSGPRTRPTMAVLHLLKLGKIPGLRRLIPWMDPKKNSMTYLPINESMGDITQQILPIQVVHDFIDKSDVHVIMNKCGCRLARKCEHFTNEIGCLFMGETALHLPHGVSRRVSREVAHAHVERAAEVGLVPITGKIRIDNFSFLTPDKNKLLSVCFCCHCCCMMTAFKQIPGPYLDNVMTPLEGLVIEVTEKCQGCGICMETCGFDAITIVNGRAVHSDQCRGCGRCERFCPNHAVRISITNPNAVADAEQRIMEYVNI